MKTTGDGFLATFDRSARAIRAARAIADAVHQLGIEVRAGLHTGEAELRNGDIGGIAVHIGARVLARAGPGEALVSSTVKDPVTGSGIEFADRAEHELKGVPGTWRLYSVASRAVLLEPPANARQAARGGSRRGVASPPLSHPHGRG